MLTIETDRLSGDTYVLTRRSDLDSAPEDIAERARRGFGRNDVSTVVIHREDHSSGEPLYGMVTMKDKWDESGVDEIIDFLALSRGWFLEEKGQL